MWAAASRDVSSQSPPPPSDRHLSIADSIASTTVEEIKERYRLSNHDNPPAAPRPPHLRRDSMFSFNTQWTADEFSISDFPRPPGMIPRFGPAIPSSAGHLPPSSWREREREITESRDPPDSAATYTDSIGYTHSPGPLVHPSAYSSSSHLPSHFNSRPGTGSNTHSRPGTGNAAGLTVHIDNALASRSDRIEIITGPSPTSPAFKSSGSVRADSIPAQGSAPNSAKLSPNSAQDATRVSPTLASPSSHYLVPSPSSIAYTRTLNTYTQHSPTETATGTYTHNRTSPTADRINPSPTSEKIPGFPVVPPSPATAAFLREPVAPPSTHASHEGLLEPGFIRSLMKGIEHEDDGLSLEGPFGDRFANTTEHTRDSLNSYPRDSIASSAYPRDSYPGTNRQHPYEYSVEDVRTQTDDLEPLEPPRGFFRRAPAASLPSSPRSSFSFSVRSGVTGRGGYGAEDVPEVPKIPDAFRPPHSKRRSVLSTTTGVTGTGTMTGTEETGIVQHAVIVRTASQRRPAVYRTTDDIRALSPISPASFGPTPSPLSAPPTSTLPPAPATTPISYNGKTSPIPYAGTRDLGSAHARTTSTDLSVGGDVVRRKGQLAALTIPGPRPRERSVVVQEEEDDLVYVRGEDVQRERESRYEPRESQYRESQYNPRESQYRQSQYNPRESQYNPRETRYDMRGSRYDDSYLDSPYMAHWTDIASPNEITPALRDSMINDTASYMRPGHAGLNSPAAMNSPGVLPSPGGLYAPGALHSPGGGLNTPGSSSTPGTPFRLPFANTPSSAPATPGHDPPRHAKRASGISFVSSVFSKFSGHASAGHNTGSKGFQFAWRNEPVPPMPAVTVRHQDSSTRASSIARKEGTMELPQLAQRAERLNEMLELGKLPHRSKSTLGTPSATTPGRAADFPVGVDQEGNDLSGEGFTDEKALRRGRSIRSVFTTLSDRSRRFMPGGAGGSGSLRSSLVDIPGQQHQRFNKLPEEHRQERKVQWDESTGVPPPRPTRSRTRNLPKKKLYTLAAIAGLAIIAIVGVSVGLTRAHAKTPDAAGYTCSATNQTGQLCDLAQVLVDLVEPVNRLFDPSPAFTPSSVALSLWEIQGNPLPGANCANQADLVDVGPALSYTEQGVAANRTEFARSALLWTLVMSMDPNTTASMQRFIKRLDFTKLDSGPESVYGEFLYGVTGFQFDFARMTVSQPAMTWQGSGKPSADQVVLVDDNARKALDRVYTFASGRVLASSSQRSSALSRYWTNTLQFSASQLSDFRNIASASPVLLPFDASSSAVRALFSNVNQSFPPPAACFPGLSADELDAINSMETMVFGLDRISSAPLALDASCFPSRPVYGVLDLARLRSSFGPSEDNAPKQAVQVSANATSRLSIRLGRSGAGLPSTSIATANLTGSSDPRTFGTINSMDHVLLTYLQAFPSIQAAGALVEHVLASSESRAPPPTNTSALYNLTSGLTALPVLEVAFFGRVGPTDLVLAHADFAAPSGELFFGSRAGDAFRNWAVQRTDQVVWSDGPNAAQVVREGQTKDQTFEEVWDAAGLLLSNAETTGTKTSRSDVAQIASAFARIGYMGS
ncbi:unnamed protein product [Rhizoctonia solani]|uniref:Uncharacterized protein n=1 Tax=Rhizoctonia solani TaxID=456999 RepID=A0A8H3ACK0_9AGAM|nr:unnamed protein product [Rhizoctonia solani]